MLTISFRCQLPNGIHARPASALETRAAAFHSAITLINVTKSREASAKSVLALVSADVTLGDECLLQIEGPDEAQAHAALAPFIADEFNENDAPLTQPETTNHALPVFLARTTSQYVRGNGVSPGLAQGRAVQLTPFDLHALALAEPAGDVEIPLLQAALQRVRQQLEDEAGRATGEAASILDAQSQLLGDETVEEILCAPREARNTLAALACAVDELRLPFRDSGSDYLRQRELDIEDLGLRLAACLTSRITLPVLTQDPIIVCHGRVTPGQLLALRSAGLQGIVMGEGAETSHTVILARALGIPLLCVAQGFKQINEGDALMLDARCGVLVIAPDSQANRWFTLEQQKQQRMTTAVIADNKPAIAPALVLLDASPVDKSEAIKRLTDNLHIQQRVLSGDDAERAIWQREEVFTTALGFSVAIPHCKSPAITHSSISVMRLTEPVAWGGDVDVQLIIMLTISEHEADRHMRIFSALARKLMHESFRQQLMTVATPEAMVTMLSAEIGL